MIICLISVTISAQEISTVREIFDYEINDIFHYRYEESWGTNVISTITNIEIIEKYYSESLDTLFYERDIEYRRRVNENPWIYEYFVDTIIITDLDSLINFGDIDTVYVDNDLYNGRVINKYHASDEHYYEYFYYVEGCGLANRYYSDINPLIIEDVLVYFKKGNEEWGEQLPVEVIELELIDYNISLYPNPSQLVFNIKSEIPLEGNVNIYTVKGRFIKEFQLNQEIKNYDISQLEEGTYIVEIELAERRLYKKLIKR